MSDKGRSQDVHEAHSDRGTGLLFGLIAGSTLLLTTWGFDGWTLMRAGGVLPWVKAGLGAAFVLLPLGALGSLSIRLQNSLLAALMWLPAGALFGWLAAQAGFRFIPWLLARWMPDLARFLDYSYGSGPSMRGTLSSIFCALVFFVAGLVIDSLAEAWSRAVYPASRALAMVVWVGLFAVSGGGVDSLINRPLSVPVATIDGLIAFRLSDPAAMDTGRARILHASVLNPVVDLLPSRHRIVVAGYDDTIMTVRVIVDFEGKWVECTLIETQPVFCQPLE